MSFPKGTGGLADMAGSGSRAGNEPGTCNLPAAEETEMSEAVASGTQSHVGDRQGWDRHIGHSTASMSEPSEQ